MIYRLSNTLCDIWPDLLLWAERQDMTSWHWQTLWSHPCLSSNKKHIAEESLERWNNMEECRRPCEFSKTSNNTISNPNLNGWVTLFSVEASMKLQKYQSRFSSTYLNWGSCTVNDGYRFCFRLHSATRIMRFRWKSLFMREWSYCTT